MSAEYEAAVEIREAIRELNDTLSQFTAAVSWLPDKETLLVGMLVCQHIQTGGRYVTDSTLEKIVQDVRRIIEATHCDLSKNPAENHTSEE